MLSVVICSADDQKSARAVAMYDRLLAGTAFETILIRDASGLAEGYNRGLRQSRGELVLFAHDDVEFLAPDFAARLLGHMQNCDVLGVAGTRRLTSPTWLLSGLTFAYGQIAYPNYLESGQYLVIAWNVPYRRVDRLQALDGVFICARRSVAEALKFDEQTFTNFHLYDLDFTFRAHLAGYRQSVACDLYPLHTSTGRNDDAWMAAARSFMLKFAGRLTLPPSQPRSYKNSAMFLRTPEDVVAVMTPLHWDEPILR